MAVSVSTVLPSSSLKIFLQISHVQYSLLPASVQVGSCFGVWVRVPWVTVTSQVAVFPLSSAAVAVMVAVPALMAVTVPSSLTVAMLVSLLSQVTPRLVASSGFTVAIRVSLLFSCKVRLSLFSSKSVTGMNAGFSIFKVNSLLSEPMLLVAVTVKVEVPAAVGVPVILPSSLNFNPVGRVPLARLHVMVSEPVAPRS